MVEPVTLLGLFGKTLGVLGLIREGRQRRNEQIDRALFALYTALCETRVYVRDLENGERRSRKKEVAIAHLWHAASVPLRYIDRDLADRCFLKGSYWLDEEAWTQERINSSGIALDTMLEKTRDILIKM